MVLSRNKWKTFDIVTQYLNYQKEPIITQSVPNLGARPFGRRGIRKKRTNITIIAEDKKAGSKK